MRLECYEERDRVLFCLGFKSYPEYLKSDLWERVKNLAFAEHGKDCFVCGRRATVLHHVSYSASVLVGEDLSKIIPLCHKCHGFIEVDKDGHKRSLEGANALLGFGSGRKHKPRRKRHKKCGPREMCKRCGNPSRKGKDFCGPCLRAIKKERTNPQLEKANLPTEEGQPCRKCGTPVTKKEKRKTTHKRGQTYGFRWYFWCPKCRMIYHTEDARYPVYDDSYRPDDYGDEHMKSLREEKIRQITQSEPKGDRDGHSNGS